MFSCLTIREMVFLSLAAALLFAINLLIGGSIVAISGIPLSSAFVTALMTGMMVIIVSRTVPKFWAWTIVLLVYSILEMPTPLGGAPGFWPKIPINVITGFAADFLLWVTAYRMWGMYAMFYVLAAVNLGAFAFFLWLLELPGVDRLIGLLPIIIGTYWVVGTIGLYVGTIVYARIETRLKRVIG